MRNHKNAKQFLFFCTCLIVTVILYSLNLTNNEFLDMTGRSCERMLRNGQCADRVEFIMLMSVNLVSGIVFAFWAMSVTDSLKSIRDIDNKFIIEDQEKTR